MAKIKEIYVEMSVTKNLGNFQNFKPTCGMTVIVDETDKVSEVWSKAWDKIANEIAGQLNDFNTQV